MKREIQYSSDRIEGLAFKVGLANGNFRHLRMFIGFAYRAARIESTPENLHRLRTVLRQAKKMQADTEVE